MSLASSNLNSKDKIMPGEAGQRKSNQQCHNIFNENSLFHAFEAYENSTYSWHKRTPQIPS